MTYFQAIVVASLAAALVDLRRQEFPAWLDCLLIAALIVIYGLVWHFFGWLAS